MAALVVPVVNLNGSSRESLVNQQRAIMDPLRTAIRAMEQASPHGRDFQHLIRGSDWYEHDRVVRNAQHAWGERLTMLRGLLEELEQHAFAISQQGK